ncbi:aldehyde dehydrogenase family protein [Pseudomonas veronii]
MKLTDLHLLRQQAYIDGRWVDADNGARFAVTNPANDQLITHVAALGQADTARAIAAAKAALPAWRAKTAKERSQILRTWYDLILANQEDLARLLSWEQGNPLAELGERAGLAPGVLNIVTGDDAPAIGGELTGNPKVQKLSFTGSTGVGKLLMAQCAQTIKKVSLELGGNAPFIVFDDADLDAAVEGALGSKFRNSGQTCVCTNRLLVQNGIYDAFSRRLAAAVNALKVAPADDEGAQQGPLINAKAVAKVQEHIRDAVSKGARILAGGKPHALGGGFFEPTVLGDVTSLMQVAREETFGPLAPIFRFDTEEQAIAMANDTEFGLASYLYTRDLSRAWRVSEALEYGMVGVNEGLISTEVAPFGGIKQSGLGREGSKYGIDDYIEQKYLCLGIQ